MWGAELAALLGFPLGRGFEVHRITDALVKHRHAVARLADAAHRCRRALALARRLEAVWTNQFWTSCRTKSQDPQNAPRAAR